MSPITTHVLDTSAGRPAAGLAVVLERKADGWQQIGAGTTDADGRITDLLPEGALATGEYRITFDTGGYFTSRGTPGFYPTVRIHFEITEPHEHYHVPLLLSPFGYSTYRGS